MTLYKIIKNELHVGFVFASKLNRNTNSTFAGFNLNLLTDIDFRLLGFNCSVAHFSNKAAKVVISIAEDAAPKSDSVRGLAITLIERLPGSLNQTGTGVGSEKKEDLSTDSDKHIHNFIRPDSEPSDLKYNNVSGSNIINDEPVLSISEVPLEFNPEGNISDFKNSSDFTEGNLSTLSGVALLESEGKKIIPDLGHLPEYPPEHLEVAPVHFDIFPERITVLDLKIPVSNIGLFQEPVLPTAFSSTSLNIGLSSSTNNPWAGALSIQLKSMCSELDSIAPRVSLCKDPAVILDFETRSSSIKQSCRIVEEEILSLNYLKSSDSLSREDEATMQRDIMNNFIKVCREAFSLDDFFKKLHKISEKTFDSTTLPAEAAATVITQAVVAGCTGNFSVAMGAGSVAGGVVNGIKNIKFLNFKSFGDGFSQSFIN